MAQVSNTVEDFQQLWRIFFPTVEAPDARQWALWIMLHGPDVVRNAIAKLVVRYQRAPAEFNKRDSLRKFASSIMARLTREANSTTAPPARFTGEISQ